MTEHLTLASRRSGGTGGTGGSGSWTVLKILELLPRLAECRKHLGGQLSGGEQQMLAIARALLTGPRMLLWTSPPTVRRPRSWIRSMR